MLTLLCLCCPAFLVPLKGLTSVGHQRAHMLCWDFYFLPFVLSPGSSFSVPSPPVMFKFPPPMELPSHGGRKWSTHVYQALRCLGILSSIMASILLCIIACVTLFFSMPQSSRDSQTLAILCLEAVKTCIASFSWALVKSQVQWFNKAKAGSGDSSNLTREDNILKTSA